jgi:hypothetical protein
MQQFFVYTDFENRPAVKSKEKIEYGTFFFVVSEIFNCCASLQMPYIYIYIYEVTSEL